MLLQAMNAQEAREMLQASLQKPNLVAQVVPSPITFTWDATIQEIIQDQTLGELIYVEVLSIAQFCSRISHVVVLEWHGALCAAGVFSI